MCWLALLCTAAHAAPAYVGSATCQACHAEQATAWQASHHAQALQPATPATVLGDFADARFEHHGQRARFTRRGDRFFVHTAGADGREAAFEVTHVIGVAPLQQLLIAMPGGRQQAFGIAWDSRPKAQGGQRWYPLQPDDPPAPGDPLHWTGREQTANFQCNGCHATAWRTGYDEATDRYASTQAELGVGCEACHGPGSGHVDWASRGRAAASPTKGFGTPQARLNRRVFAFLPGHPIAQPQGPPANDAADTCLGCHARRSQLLETAQADAPFLDQFSPLLIGPGAYHADGRIDGEVFEYGSFAQSAMHAAGVTCTHCHDPHSAKPRAAGNTLCAQCHLPARYDSPGHGGAARDPAAGAAPRCTDCHMPTQTYMGVHVRHDHSLRVPGAPARAASAFVQASALARGEAAAALPQAVHATDPLLRLGAARGLATLPPAQALAWGAPLLADERLAVRIEAARALATVPPGAWPAAVRPAAARAMAEWEASERPVLDRPEAVVNLAQAWLVQGRHDEVEALLRRTLRRAPDFAPLYVVQAELLRRTGRDANAEAPLGRAVTLAPREATALKALGLWLVRQRRLEEAVGMLERAVREAPQDAGLVRTLGLARAAVLGAPPVTPQAGAHADPKR